MHICYKNLINLNLYFVLWYFIYFLFFSYGISKNGCCIIADDMGLGKTLQALGIAYYFKDSWPLLIITPSSVK